MVAADSTRTPTSSSGYAFHPRCRYAQAICSKEEPPLVNLGKNGNTHLAACQTNWIWQALFDRVDVWVVYLGTMKALWKSKEC